MKSNAIKWQATLLFPALMALVISACAPEKPSKARLEGQAGGAESAESQANIDQTPVARVNDEEITLAEFNRRVNELPEFARVRYASVAQKQDWLDSVVQFEVMADVAEKKGLGASPEVFYALKAAMADQLLDDITREKVSMNDITAADIQAYYKARRADFWTPAARRVALLEASTREEAAQLRRRVQAEMDRAEEGPVIGFRRAAAAYSTDREVADKGGDIGFISRPTAPLDDRASVDARRRAQIAEAVFQLLEPGDLTPVFPLDRGWGLATFIEERPEKTRSLDEASNEIRQTLYEARRRQIIRDFVASLRKDAKIEVFQDEVDATEAPPPPTPRKAGDIALRSAPVFGVEEPTPAPDTP